MLLVCGAALTGAASAQTSASEDEVAQADAQHRLEQIDIRRNASGARYAADKKACASKILVSGCTRDALQRRQARDDELDREENAAHAELRGLALTAKNRSLAGNLPSPESERAAVTQRSEALKARADKLADLQERRAEHERKKSLEAENRRAYDAKQANAVERQAQAVAKKKVNEEALQKAAEHSAAPAASRPTGRSAEKALRADAPGAAPAEGAGQAVKASVN